MLGPGSWFTSVLPHLYVRPVHDAIVSSAATKVLVVNVAPQVGETSGFIPAMYLDNLATTFPDMRLDAVIVDPSSVHDESALQAACAAVGAEVVIEEVRAVEGGRPQPVHDTLLLASVFQRFLV